MGLRWMPGACAVTMSSMLPHDEATALITWAQQGADRPTFDTFVAPLLDKRCISCHDGSNPHLISLGGYDNVKKVTDQDKGTDIFTLVRVSHIHLFGLTWPWPPRSPLY